MGNSVKLCLLFATHLVARARTHQTKIMIFEKAFISYLVIMSTCSGLPVNQEEAEVVNVKDEAIFEALRDHELQLSMNGGQSGGWFRLFDESEETSSSRPKRQDDAMVDDLVVPPVVLPVTVAPTTTEAPAPIDDAYAQRLEGSAIALANKLANAKRQEIVRSGGYGRKKRQAFLARARPISTNPATLTSATRTRSSSGYGRKKRQAPVQPVTVAPTTETPAPIPRLEGSAIALANKLANAKPQTIVRAGGYGRKKRQISEEEEAILQEISEIESLLPESTVIQVIIPQVKSWGETGIVLPVKSSA